MEATLLNYILVFYLSFGSFVGWRNFETAKRGLWSKVVLLIITAAIWPLLLLITYIQSE